MTRDDLYQLICDTDDADPANALIAIDAALAGEISYGELYAMVVKEQPCERNRRQDDDTDNLPTLSRGN